MTGLQSESLVVHINENHVVRRVHCMLGALTATMMKPSQRIVSVMSQCIALNSK